MGKLKEIFEVLEQKPVAFVIKGSPDPDAIASSLALLTYYQSLGGEGTIYHEDHVSHSANKAMVNILDIKMTDSELKNITEPFYVICDHCDPIIEANTKCVLHIDHHKMDPTEERVDFPQIIEYDAGSCSSIITKLLDEENFLSSSGTASQISTALMYGIRTDTDDMDGAREKDWDAMKILSQFFNKDHLQKITRSRISTQTARVLKQALAVEKEEQNWLYAGVGFLQEAYRDSIALVADEMMRRQGVDNVLVYAIVEKDGTSSVQGSVRSIDAGFDIDGFVKGFSTSAGGRKYKGGFEIPLGFWGDCTNREQLEDFVETCVEEKLKILLGADSTQKIKKKGKREEIIEKK